MTDANSETAEPRPWVVLAQIAGPKLPRTRIEIGGITLGPRAPEDGVAPTITNPSVNGNGSYSQFFVTEADLSIVSECYARIPVMARGAMEAARIGRELALPQLAAALSLGHSGVPHRIKFLGLEDARGTTVGLVHVAASFYNDEILSEADRNYADETYKAISRDPILSRASILLWRGLTLEDAGGDVTTKAASLMAYYQVVETCANAVPWIPPQDLEMRRADILRILEQKLSRASQAKTKAAAVEQAAGSLRRLKFISISAKMEHAAAVLNLPPEWKIAMKALHKLRNSRLGHAEELPRHEELDPWFTTREEGRGAYWVGQTIVEALMAHQRLQASTSPDPTAANVG